MESYKHNKIKCPVCNYASDHSAAINKEKAMRPIPGDFTLCINCGTILRYLLKEDEYIFRIAADKELASFAIEDPLIFGKLLKGQQLIRTMPRNEQKN